MPPAQVFARLLGMVQGDTAFYRGGISPMFYRRFQYSHSLTIAPSHTLSFPVSFYPSRTNLMPLLYTFAMPPFPSSTLTSRYKTRLKRFQGSQSHQFHKNTCCIYPWT